MMQYSGIKKGCLITEELPLLQLYDRNSPLRSPILSFFRLLLLFVKLLTSKNSNSILMRLTLPFG